MSAALADHWHHAIDGAYAKHGPAAIAALVAELDRRGDLDPLKDRLLAEVADELRADNLRARADGKLGRAVELIQAGEAKQRVLAAGISRRTYFRARRECQSAKQIETGA